MPWSCPTVCAKVGCSTLVAKPGFCAEHLSEARKHYNTERFARNDPTDRFYHTAAWRRTRAAVLRREPLCRLCTQSGITRLATLVDHIVPVKHGGAMWDPDNLQPLCNLCHERKSASEGSRGRRAG